MPCGRTAGPPRTDAPSGGGARVSRLRCVEILIRSITYTSYVITGIGAAGLVEYVKSFLGREREDGGRECATPAPPSVWRSLR